MCRWCIFRLGWRMWAEQSITQNAQPLSFPTPYGSYFDSLTVSIGLKMQETAPSVMATVNL